MSWNRCEFSGEPFAELATLEQTLAEESILTRLLGKDSSLLSAMMSGDASAAHAMDWIDSGFRSAYDITDIVPSYVQSNSVVLVGMGGANVSARAYACLPKLSLGRSLRVLDTTAPDAVLDVVSNLSDNNQFFVICSKSGTTVETLDLARSLFERVQAPQAFLVVTDPTNSALREWAIANKIAACPSDPCVAGRFAAFSNLTLIPTQVIGIDNRQILETVSAVVKKLKDGESNLTQKIIRLAAILAGASKTRQHNLWMWASTELSPVLNWVEQLVAESLGKSSLGLLPVIRVSKTDAESGDEIRMEIRRGFEDSGVALSFHVADLSQLAEFFLNWGLAVVMAALLIGVNPFNQPDVERSKQLLIEKLSTKTDKSSRRIDSIETSVIKSRKSFESLIKEIHVSMARTDYLALLVYCSPSAEIERLVQKLVDLISDLIDRTVVYSYGPQYLHSTGQFHKGGWEAGRFVVIGTQQENDLPVSQRDYTFSKLFNTQAAADADTLIELGKPVDCLWLQSPVCASLEGMIEYLQNCRGSV